MVDVLVSVAVGRYRSSASQAPLTHADDAGTTSPLPNVVPVADVR